MIRKVCAVLFAAAVLVAVFSACASDDRGTAAVDAPRESELSSGITEDVTPDAPVIEAAAIAFEAYTELWERMSGANVSYDIDFAMFMEMSMDDGFSMSFPSSGNMRLVLDGDTLQSSMTMSVPMLGEMAVYLEMTGNEVTFMRQSVDGSEIDIFEIDDLLDMMNSTVDMPDIDFDAVIYADVETMGGMTIITMLLDGQAIIDFALASVEDQLGELGAHMTMTLADMPITIVKDSGGNPMSMEMGMDMTVEADGEAIHLRVTTEFVFNAFGGGVIVAMPV